ncbi:MAG: YceD family protein [Halioglobus sp.]
MLTEPLPNSLDVRKAATRGVSVNGVLKPLNLQHFRDLLADDEGAIEANLVFSRDQENRFLVTVTVTADVALVCQRCLESMPAHLEASNVLAVVWDDEYARQLPQGLEPLIVGDELCNLWNIVEEELILGMPAFSYHEEDNCNELLVGLNQTTPPEVAVSEKPNPFNVLEQLKPGKKD